MMWKRSGFFAAALVAVVLSGCKVTVPESVQLQCSAVPLVQGAVPADEEVTIRVTASGGDNPYQIQGKPGTFASYTDIERSYSNDTENERVVEDVVVVTDDLGLTAQCSFSVTVEPGEGDEDPEEPTLTAVVSPAASVPVGSTITVTATAQGLGNNPIYVFQYTQSGVAMSQNGNQAVFSVTDNQAHSFNVTIRAIGNGVEKTLVRPLVFTASTPQTLNCTLTHTGSNHKVGDIVEFRATAQNGTPLEIANGGHPGSGGIVVSRFGDTVSIQYNTPGTKTVQVFARSAIDGTWCNNAMALEDSVQINEQGGNDPDPDPNPSQLACTAHTDMAEQGYPNTYRVWCDASYPNWNGMYFNSILTWAVVTGAQGGGTPRIVGISVSNGGQGHYDPYDNNPLAKEVMLYTSGSYRLTLKVRDGAGNETTCRTPVINVVDTGECMMWAWRY